MTRKIFENPYLTVMGGKGGEPLTSLSPSQLSRRIAVGITPEKKARQEKFCIPLSTLFKSVASFQEVHLSRYYFEHGRVCRVLKFPARLPPHTVLRGGSS